MLCLLPKRLWRDNRTKKSTSLSPGLLWPDERAAQTPMIEWMKEEDDDDECRKEMAAAAVAVTTPPPPAAAISNDSRNKDREPLSGAEWRMCCKSMHREREGEEGRHNPTQPNPAQPSRIQHTHVSTLAPLFSRQDVCAKQPQYLTTSTLFFFFGVCACVQCPKSRFGLAFAQSALSSEQKPFCLCVREMHDIDAVLSLSIHGLCRKERGSGSMSELLVSPAFA